MTTLKFPELEGFIKYLMEKDIRRYGIVSICEVSPSSEGHGIYKESFRLTTVHYPDAQSIAKEILQCDIPYYRSIFVTEKHNREEAKEPKEKALAAIMEKIKELTEPSMYDLQLLGCQFSE